MGDRWVMFWGKFLWILDDVLGKFLLVVALWGKGKGCGRGQIDICERTSMIFGSYNLYLIPTGKLCFSHVFIAVCMCIW